MIQVTRDSNNDKLGISAFVTRYLNYNKDNNITMIATHVYSWIPKYVFQLGEYYWIPEEIDLIETSPKINRSLLVVDGTFKSVMSGNDEIGERLRNVYNANTKNKTTSIEVGSYHIILPEVHFSRNLLVEDKATNVLSSEYKWKLKGSGWLSHVDGNLTILVKTNGTDKISRNAILRKQLNNLTESPLLLSLLYTSKSPEGNDRFSVEIKDNDTQKRYLKGLLMDTSGNETSQLFVLPKGIVGKPAEFRFGVITNTPGEHTLTLKSVRIIYKL
jgi:hypothetical protein